MKPCDVLPGQTPSVRRCLKSYVHLARVLGGFGTVPGGEIEREDFASWHAAHLAQLALLLPALGVLHSDLAWFDL